MLSIQRCRAILGRAAGNMSDVEVERVRDEFRALACIAIDMFQAQRRKGSQSEPEEALDKLGQKPTVSAGLRTLDRMGRQ